MNKFTRTYVSPVFVACVLCVAFFTTLFFVACQGASAMSCKPQSMRNTDMPTQLALPEGQAWVATSVLGVPAKAGMDGTLLVRFTVDDAGKFGVSGYDGCNFFFGSYTAKDATLQFSHMGSTRRMCMPELVLDGQTQALYELMSTPVEVLRDGDTMEWWQNGQVRLRWKVGTDPFYKPKSKA